MGYVHLMEFHVGPSETALWVAATAFLPFCQGHSHPSAPSVKVSTLISSLSGLPVTAPVGCPISTKDKSKAWIPERVMVMSASNLVKDPKERLDSIWSL